MRRLWEKFCAFLFGLLAGFFVLAFFYQPSRQWPADFIIRHDAEVNSADAIIMLMGNVGDRAPHCAKLLKKGVAPRIVFTEAEQGDMETMGFRTPDGVASEKYLLRLGVKPEAIIFNAKAGVSNTFDELKANFALIKERLPQTKRVVLCTSWYHSSRAHWAADKVNEHYFELKSIPSQRPKVWYAKESDFLVVFNEYLKWAYYLTHY